MAGLVSITAEPLTPGSWSGHFNRRCWWRDCSVAVPMLDKFKIDDVVGLFLCTLSQASGVHCCSNYESLNATLMAQLTGYSCDWSVYLHSVTDSLDDFGEDNGHPGVRRS